MACLFWKRLQIRSGSRSSSGSLRETVPHKASEGNKISVVQRAIREALGYKRQVVNEHVNYLAGYGYIDIESSTVKAPAKGGGGTMRESITKTYRISSKGDDFIRGKSMFSPKDKYPGINISAVGSAVVLGDGNVVNVQHHELHQELSRLGQIVSDSKELSDAQKLDLCADVETIKDQLAKVSPDKGTLSRAWRAIENGVTGAALVDYVARVAPMIGALIS